MMVFGLSGLSPPQVGNLRLEAERRKDLDNVLGHVRKMAKDVHHGPALKDIDIAEGYTRGDLYIRLIASRPTSWVPTVCCKDCPPCSEIRYYNATFQVSRAAGNNADVCVRDGEILKNGAHPNSADRDQIAMLIHIAQTTKRPELFLPSFVRLQCNYDILNIGWEAKEFSLISPFLSGGAVNVLDAFTEGEIDVADTLHVVRPSNYDHQLIERGSQVIDRFWNEHEQDVRDTSNKLYFCQAISRLGVWLNDKSVGITFEHGIDFPFDIVDVRVGPINLQSGATEGVGLDA